MQLKVMDCFTAFAMTKLSLLTRLTQQYRRLTILRLQLIPAGQNYSWQDDALAVQAVPKLDAIASLGFNFLAKVPA
jgi:hypothetical protein